MRIIGWFAGAYVVSLFGFAGYALFSHKTTNLDKVVMLHVGNYLGSGAYVSERGTVLTCAHLFAEGEGKKIFVRSHSGAVSVGNLTRLDKVHDLAVVQTYPLHNTPYFRIGKAPQLGDPVITYGSPLGINDTMTRGWVENLDIGENKMTIQGAPINPGNSGGPLVNEAGELVGVNISMWMLNFLVPANGLGNAVNVQWINKILAD